MVYPLTLRFLSTYQLSAEIENQISLNSYIDNFMMLVLCMGLAFELPLVTWLLSLLGLVNKSFLRKYRRHAIVLIVIAAAVITPTGDPFTLSIVAIPLYLLYEMSILMIKDKPLVDPDYLLFFAYISFSRYGLNIKPQFIYSIIIQEKSILLDSY